MICTSPPHQTVEKNFPGLGPGFAPAPGCGLSELSQDLISLKARWHAHHLHSLSVENYVFEVIKTLQRSFANPGCHFYYHYWM